MGSKYLETSNSALKNTNRDKTEISKQNIQDDF